MWINKQAKLPRWSKARRLDLSSKDFHPAEQLIPIFFVLCNWIKTGAPRHAVKSSPDEPRLEKLWLLSTNRGGDKADRQPVMEGCGPAEHSPQAGSTQEQMTTFCKATRHKKHWMECPLHFILPASWFYIKGPKVVRAAFNKDASPAQKRTQCVYAFIFKGCWIKAQRTYNFCNMILVLLCKWNWNLSLRIIFMFIRKSS